MQRKGIIAGLLLAVVITAGSCIYPFERIQGTGNASIEHVETKGFHSIHTHGIVDVDYGRGSSCQVRLEAQENLRDYIEIYVRDSILVIDVQSGYNLKPTVNLKAHVTLPDVFSLKSTGTGDMLNTEPFDSLTNLEIITEGTGNITCHWSEAESVWMESDGTGNIKARGNCMDLLAETDGTGDIDFAGITAYSSLTVDGTGDCYYSGSCSSQKVKLNGTGDYYGMDFLSAEAEVTINGSGNAELAVSERLRAEINGSGDIICSGTPELNLQTNGTGNYITVSS
jgi:hypothetical protein